MLAITVQRSAEELSLASWSCLRGMEVLRSTENLVATAMKVRVAALRGKREEGNQSLRRRMDWKASTAIAAAQAAEAAAM